MKRVPQSLSATLLAFIAPLPLLGGNADIRLQVTASVVDSCRVHVSSAAAVRVHCAPGTAYRLELEGSDLSDTQQPSATRLLSPSADTSPDRLTLTLFF